MGSGFSFEVVNEEDYGLLARVAELSSDLHQVLGLPGRSVVDLCRRADG